MGELLEVDLDTLRWLGGQLGGHADAITTLRLSAVVNMGDSPIQAVSAQVGTAVLEVFGLIGGNLKELSEKTVGAVKTYEDFEQVNTDLLNRYNEGR
ncbi:hypothetical protein [Nocardia abscessus]|uniref:hypothetical protein n=1 Tax=Nocardia abscessus TaxID=120957 RepID=UPI0005BCF794|nr:hypothetical protein [Nocardia abscessus]MCC3330920.1 hypothetical protein [Nocardia abscessus]